ncbi:ATP-binding protein [Streptomyces sp. NPDC058001]|uniref:ATP-binding protein n=1 Tax=Streptomyces sp. NPDC058001 TaxID=3346300 RepID=UPI0036E34D73
MRTPHPAAPLDGSARRRDRLSRHTSPAVQPKTPTSRGFEVAVTPERVHVARIRRITVAHLRLWALSDALAEDVRLVVSELVTNAVEHGKGTVSLRVRHTPSLLRIEVTDESPAPAQLQSADGEDLSGRGLFLVAAVSSDWGVSRDGRTIWADFRIPAGRP